MRHIKKTISWAVCLGAGLLAVPTSAQLPTAKPKSGATAPTTTNPPFQPKIDPIQKDDPAPTAQPKAPTPNPTPKPKQPAPQPIPKNDPAPTAKPKAPISPGQLEPRRGAVPGRLPAARLGGSPIFAPKLNDGRQGLRGFVDMHAHPMSHLGFGGHLMHGAPGVGVLMLPGTIFRAGNCNEKPRRARSQAEALGSCLATHGGHDLFSNTCGNHVRRLILNGMEDGNNTNKPHSINHPPGHPSYTRWPKHDDILHQQMWVDWIERSYQGGMRVMVALAVNNYTLAEGLEATEGNPRTDRPSGDLQIKELRRFVAQHHRWMAIANSAEDLRRIVGEEDKLAIIIGAELDDMGDFVVRKNRPSAEAVRREIRRLHRSGVRYIFPVHLVDNYFAGAAAYETEVNRANCYHYGEWINLRCADHSARDEAGITTRLESGNDLFKLMKLGRCGDHAPVPSCGGNAGHLNKRGLQRLGKEAIDEMMRLGMIIDIDHASLASLHQILDHTANTPGGAYPLVSGHNGVRPANGGNENQRTQAQYEELRRRQSIAGVGWGALRSDQWLAKLRDVRATGIPIAIGSDINGMVVQPRQRSGCSPQNPCVTYSDEFPRLRSGSMTWDYNQHGVANVGLFPDLLKDIEGQQGGRAIVQALFDGAEAIAKTWEKAESVGSQIPKPNLAGTIDVTSARYGANCGISAAKGTFASWVQEQCVGEKNCMYRFTWAPWGGDPNPSMCKKEIHIRYRCGSQQKEVRVMHENTPQSIRLTCP
jgi:microsomal dipeptidase-like Zn-dependent dipeptidase